MILQYKKDLFLNWNTTKNFYNKQYFSEKNKMVEMSGIAHILNSSDLI